MRMARTAWFCIFVAITLSASGREWSDGTGSYQIEADLVGFDDENAILQREDGELGAVRIEDLSEKDRAYLESKEAAAVNEKQLKKTQAWTTRSGIKILGRVVDYLRGDVVIQRRRGRMYVNDRAFNNLPEFYQKLLPKVVEHFEEIEIPDDQALQNWLLSLRGQPRTFPLTGVILELENGNEYSIPFFVFADADRKVLKTGWSSWLAAQDDYDQLDDHAFRLEALAAAHARQQELKQQQIALINLQAVHAGLTSAWEVTLHPARGNPSPPRWVVVPGRNSAQATATALQQNPGFVAGPVRRVSR